MTRPHKGLRIAMMLDSDGPGGAEMMVFQLSAELRERGHTVVPLLPRDGVGWLGDVFRSAGFSPESFWLKRPVDAGAVIRLIRFFRRFKIDVIHSHEFTMAVYGAASAMLLGVPHLITMHGGLTVTNALRRRISLRWAIRRSAFAVAVSNATRLQFAKDLGILANAFTVIHNGVPFVSGSAEHVRREFDCKEGEIVILAVGNLERNKNHRMLLEALVRLRYEGLTIPWKVIIAAGRGGEQYSELFEYIQTHDLQGRVAIASGRSDIADLQALTDIFAMPSLWEGLPMALLEAMVAGKAIVASKTGGIPEAIVDGAQGILVPPGDVGALACALRTLLVDGERRRSLAAAARERARNEFTVQVMTDRYVELYGRMLEGRS